MATPRVKRASSGEDVELTVDVERATPSTHLAVSTVGIPGDPIEVADIQVLAGNVLRGKAGLRFSTGRRDGEAPALSVGDATRLGLQVRGPAGRSVR